MTNLSRAELFCFDNDGTLFASHEVANPAIQRSYVRFCRERGIEAAAPSDEEICRLTGKPGPVFYHEILPPALRHLAAEFREECLDEEVAEVTARGRLYPGIQELLRALRGRGKKLALVTNAGHRYLGAVARRVGYEHLLDAVYHFGKNGWENKEQMIRAALEEFRPGGTVMVGDRASDLEGARGAGVSFVGCLYGYGGREEIAEADHLVRDVAELTALLTDRADLKAAGGDPDRP